MRISLLSGALALAIACALPLPARAAAPPETANASDLRLNITEHTLKNGLRLLMLEDHKAPVVTFEVWYQVGSRDEHQGITGISHAIEHMMFQGARRHGTGEFDKLLTRVGGQNNAFTTEDYTAFYETLSSDHLALPFDLESDRMTGLLIPPEKLKSEKNVIKEERRWRSENSPTGAVYEDLSALAYKAHSYHWPVIGWMSDLDTLTRDQIMGYYQTYYHPDNAIVVIVGDFRTDRAIALAERYFGNLKPGGPFPRNATVEPPQTGERRMMLRKQVENPQVIAAYHIPAANSDDLYALDLLDTILGSGQSSRLYQSLVYRDRIAQQVGTGLSENKDPGLYYVYGTPMPGHTTDEVERALYAQIDRLQSEPVSAHELQKALNIASAQFIFGKESSESLATTIGTQASLTSYRDLNTYLPRLRAVTRADIQRVARTYLTRQNRSVVTLEAPEEKK